MMNEENRQWDPDLALADEGDEFLSDDAILSADSLDSFGEDEDFEDDVSPIADELTWMGFRSPVEFV